MAEDFIPSIPSDAPHSNLGFVESFIIPPRTHHTHTLILLHGRGGNGRDFGIELITTKLQQTGATIDTLSQRFPSTKFIFPTARLLPTMQAKRLPLPQWFDFAGWDELGIEKNEEVQRQGLRESTEFVHRIIDAEAALVGVRNVVVGGLSQGAAQALHVLMSYGGGALGGYVGLCAWLPFRRDMERLMNAQPDGAVDGEDASPEDKRLHLRLRATRYSREQVLRLPLLKVNGICDDEPVSMSNATPIWLAHGSADSKVRARLGEQAAQTMERLGWEVTWMLYDGLEHGFEPCQLDDMAIFLSTGAGLPEGD